jgi:glycosyltransferase involved in cell wall biosynthesis
MAAENSMSEPKISIVTPSFNQGPFIERTIRSVLEQDWPNIEYIIIDAGSTDETVSIIEKYSDRLAYWVSEPDRGQTDAINKGLKRITGDIFAYINSDDFYYPGAFRAAATALPNGDAEGRSRKWAVGIGDHLDIHGTRVHLWKTLERWSDDRAFAVLAAPAVCQHATFWRTELLDQVGYFDESFHYGMDTEFMVRCLLEGNSPVLIDQIIGAQLLHADCKTMTGREPFDRERAELISKYRSRFSEKEWNRALFIKDLRKLVISARERDLDVSIPLALRLAFTGPQSLAMNLLKRIRTGSWAFDTMICYDSKSPVPVEYQD